MTPEQYCENKAAQSGSSFYYSFRFLPGEQRRAITALYAFCREVDDVVDECQTSSVARAKLAWWHAEVASLYTGLPTHPVTQALQPYMQRFDLPKQLLLDLLEGMAMDLDNTRYANFDELKHYCHCVAGVVGQLAARIFGFTQQATLTYAHELGIAFQLTNIIRDVGEDVRRGRCYFPEQELAQFGMTLDDVFQRRETEAFTRFMQFQIERARAYYAAAWEALPAADRKAQRVGLVMAAIYRSTLEEIALHGPAKVLNQRLSLTPLRKLWVAWKTWVFGYRP